MGVYVGDSLVAGNVGEVYTKAQVDTMIANAVALAEPVGSIKPFAGTTVPDGYLLCDGSAISRTTYAALFAVIGTTYGTGDGSTTFNLPNLGFLSGVDIPVIANDDTTYNLFKNSTNTGVAQIGVAGNNIGGARYAWLSSGQAGGNAEYYGSNMKAKLGYAVVSDIKQCIKY